MQNTDASSYSNVLPFPLTHTIDLTSLVSQLSDTICMINKKNMIISTNNTNLLLQIQLFTLGENETCLLADWLKVILNDFRKKQYATLSFFKDFSLNGTTLPVQICLTQESSITLDIQMRLQIETPLTQTASTCEARYNPFYESPTMTFVTTMDGRMVEANQAFLTATGLSCKSFGHELWTQYIAASSSQDIHAKIIQSLEDNTIINNIELTFNFPALLPSERVTLLSARAIRGTTQNYIIFTLNDISQLSQVSTDVFHMEELKVASELAASVGHEIRNPMTAVRGFLQRLGQKADFDKYQSYFHIMLEELDRANQIISEYLALTKVKTNKITTENINTIIQQLFPLLQINAVATNKTLLLDLSPIEDLLLDAKEIRQLLLNLVKNGIEAMAPGKSLTIKTYPQDAHTIVLEIKDEGTGIPPELLKKIGTPFFTTKTNGTGLGLSICYTIAQKNNASIQVQSSEQGTTFYVLFQKKEPCQQGLEDQ